jgi:hypothetical protein
LAQAPWPDGPVTLRAPRNVAVVIARTVGVTWESWPRFEDRSVTRNDSESARHQQAVPRQAPGLIAAKVTGASALVDTGYFSCDAFCGTDGYDSRACHFLISAFPVRT